MLFAPGAPQSMTTEKRIYMTHLSITSPLQITRILKLHFIEQRSALCPRKELATIIKPRKTFGPRRRHLCIISFLYDETRANSLMTNCCSQTKYIYDVMHIARWRRSRILLHTRRRHYDVSRTHINHSAMNDWYRVSRTTKSQTLRNQYSMFQDTHARALTLICRVQDLGCHRESECKSENENGHVTVTAAGLAYF